MLSTSEGQQQEQQQDQDNDVKMEEEEKKKEEDDRVPDPLLAGPSPVVRANDYVILVFGDGRQIFAQAVNTWKGSKSPPVKINKRSYPTSNLIGLPYGTVLEVGLSTLVPLPDGEDLIPEYPSIAGTAASSANDAAGEGSSSSSNNNNSNNNGKGEEESDTTMPPLAASFVNDNRHLIDTNTSQSLQHGELMKLRLSGTDGSTIVDKLIANSSTFDKKTEYSKAKYVKRKQVKYQPRCRMVRCTAATITEALYLKDQRKLMNLRDDTLGQILSYSNISAGCQTLVFETCMGVITGSVAERMGGYGKVISLYSGQQPAFNEMLGRFNLSFAEQSTIKWAHTGDVFCNDNDDGGGPRTMDPNAEDPDKVEREALEWPCPLQDHTRAFLEKMETDEERSEFLAKRCARFARKLTRHTPLEAKQWLSQRKCDSVIIVSRYDPTTSLMGLLPYLAPSRPFVVYCEYIEPLTECFRQLQDQKLAINLRLSDTWTREYQVLPGRTHPNMTISQSGGFLLCGIKLCPVYGQNEMDETLRNEIRTQIGGRRGKRPKNKNNNQTSDGNKNNNKNNSKKRKASGGRDSKRPRKDNK